MVGPGGGALPTLPLHFDAWWQSALPSRPLPEHLGVLLIKLAPKSTRSPLIGGEPLRTWSGRKAPPPVLRGAAEMLYLGGQIPPN